MILVMCHRRRRLLYLHQRSMDNREEFRAEFFEPSEQNRTSSKVSFNP